MGKSEKSAGMGVKAALGEIQAFFRRLDIRPLGIALLDRPTLVGRVWASRSLGGENFEKLLRANAETLKRRGAACPPKLVGGTEFLSGQKRIKNSSDFSSTADGADAAGAANTGGQENAGGDILTFESGPDDGDRTDAKRADSKNEKLPRRIARRHRMLRTSALVAIPRSRPILAALVQLPPSKAGRPVLCSAKYPQSVVPSYGHWGPAWAPWRQADEEFLVRRLKVMAAAELVEESAEVCRSERRAECEGLFSTKQESALAADAAVAGVENFRGGSTAWNLGGQRRAALPKYLTLHDGGACQETCLADGSGKGIWEDAALSEEAAAFRAERSDEPLDDAPLSTGHSREFCLSMAASLSEAGRLASVIFNADTEEILYASPEAFGVFGVRGPFLGQTCIAAEAPEAVRQMAASPDHTKAAVESMESLGGLILMRLSRNVGESEVESAAVRYGFTRSEHDEALRMVRGLSCKESALHSGASPETIRQKRKGIYRKMGVATHGLAVARMMGVRTQPRLFSRQRDANGLKQAEASRAHSDDFSAGG